MSLEALNSEVFARLAWTLGLIGTGILIYWSANRLILAQARFKSLGLESVHPKMPILLYFTMPTCIPCKTAQRPAIQRLQEKIGEKIQVIEIDASTKPEIAKQWGVLSVPTTFIIDTNGQARHVNHGVAPADKLLLQFSEFLEPRS